MRFASVMREITSLEHVRPVCLLITLLDDGILRSVFAGYLELYLLNIVKF